MLEEINSAARYIKEQIGEIPSISIVLGSGLGNLTSKIEVHKSIAYKEIPGFPVSTVSGHSGNLIHGTLGNKQVLAFQGRFHYYEGYNMQVVTFPIRVLKVLGIETLILSNAAGGVNPNFSVGDIMLINDHINLFPENPLRGKNLDELGPRFPDMSEPYSKDLLSLARQIATDNNIKVQEGVYCGVSGPSYESPAEYRFIKAIGADAVGMSTIPEVIVARHMNMKCFAISVITDLGGGDEVEVVTHEEVLKVAGSTEPRITLLIEELLKKLS